MTDSEDLPSLPQRIVIPRSGELSTKYMDQDHDVFTRLASYAVAEKNNRNNSARDSVELNEELMQNLKLDSDSESSQSGNYIPYHLSRAENYESDPLSDEISLVAAVNSGLNKNAGGSHTYSVGCSEHGKDEKLTNFLHQRLCTNTHLRRDVAQAESSTKNMNNNASGSNTRKQYSKYYLPEDDVDVSHYGCHVQSSKRSGYLPAMECPHKTKEVQCPRCGHKKPDLNIRDVKFAYWMPPPQRVIIMPPGYKHNIDTSGVLFRYSGMMGGKRTMDPNPSPASTPDSSRRFQMKHQLGSTDVIKLVHNTNYAAVPNLPEIGRDKRFFDIRKPNRDMQVKVTAKDTGSRGYVSAKESNHVVALPEVDLSPNSSIVGFPSECSAAPIARKNQVEPKSPKPQSFTHSSKQATFVRNSETNPVLKMQVLPPRYRNSFHGSFIPHSLLKARPPTMTSRQRMELRSRNSKTPAHDRVMAEIRLNTPTGKVHVHRKSTTPLHKDA